MTTSRTSFLRRIRARMRLAWLVATLQLASPFLALAVLVLLAVDWLTAFERGLALSGAVVGAALLGLGVAAILIRITPWDAYRAAELGMSARDALTTALEFNDPDDGVHQVIQMRADELASRSRASEAIPIGTDRRSLRVVWVVGGLALVIGLLPPIGSTPAASADLQSVLDTEADRIERISAAVRDSDVDTADGIASELERLADEIRTARSLDDALGSLEDAEARLGERIDPGFLSQKAAVQGLERDLALRPLSDGSSPDASTQLAELADALDSLSDPELAAVADRLVDLAGSQAAGNPELSSRLAEAARALTRGELGEAASSLADAATGQQTGLDGARGQQALAEAQRALEGARARLGGEEPGGGEASGQDGDGGEGEGGSHGEGAGSGDPGQGGDPGSGEVSNVAPGDGDASGQGGPGSVGVDDGEDHGSEVATADVYDPIDAQGLADLLQVGIDGGVGDGALAGTSDLPTARGEAVVPYAQVLPEYMNRAADALESLRLPASMHGIVQTYFELLADEAR